MYICKYMNMCRIEMYPAVDCVQETSVYQYRSKIVYRDITCSNNDIQSSIRAFLGILRVGVVRQSTGSCIDMFPNAPAEIHVSMTQLCVTSIACHCRGYMLRECWWVSGSLMKPFDTEVVELVGSLRYQSCFIQFTTDHAWMPSAFLQGIDLPSLL